MGRILAIDYGQRRVGLALSDPLKMIAQGLPTLIINSPQDIINWVCAQKEEREIDRIVLGLPRSLSGEMGPMAREVVDFSGRLAEETKLPVELVDERLTSRQAHATFAQGGKKLKGRKEAIDRIAAVLLLEQYLETLNPPPDEPDM